MNISALAAQEKDQSVIWYVKTQFVPPLEINSQNPYRNTPLHAPLFSDGSKTLKIQSLVKTELI